MLPVSVKNGQSATFTQACFTATSASCVTGLVVCDTFTRWSVFGQLVILVLIQTGGLGFITISTFFFLLIRRRVGLSGREVLSESINTTQIGGILRLTRRIIWGTVIFEGTGALLLALRLCPELGFVRGLYYSVFHSVSAFCNAGFDLFGIYDEYSSLTHFADDWLVNIVITALIIIGGLGFIVWNDIYEHGIRIKRYKLHSKIVLAVSAVLIVTGTLAFYIAEHKHSLAGMDVPQSALASFFLSVSARTAGFNTVDIAAMSDAGKLINVILMFIGGSPGSTAGGIKTTTLAVILVFSSAYMRRNRSCAVWGRRLTDDSLRRAASVFFTNLLLALGAVTILCILNTLPLADILLETFSALGTVGLSAGITRQLTEASKYIIIFLMYCGRVGSLSFATALVEKRAKPLVTYPAEDITIG